MQELQKYFWSNYPVIAAFSTVVVGLVTIIFKLKLREINGANRRLYKEIVRLDKKIKAVGKCVSELKPLVYELKGRIEDD